MEHVEKLLAAIGKPPHLGQTGWEGAFERLDDLAYFGEDGEIQETAEAALEEWYLYSGQLADSYEDSDWEEFDEDEDWQDI